MEKDTVLRLLADCRRFMVANQNFEYSAHIGRVTNWVSSLIAENAKFKTQIESIREDCEHVMGANMIDGKFQEGIQYQAEHVLDLING